MPRVIKPEEHQQKHDEILDVAQRLVYTIGYEQMSIQNIIQELGISKGAFYHYFDSKQALLEAMVDRIMAEMEKFLIPIVNDPQIPALEKIERFFDSAARWKSARKEFLTSLLKTWYADENAIVRQKLTAASTRWLTPFLVQIFNQGVDEGVFDIEFCDQTARACITIMTSLGEDIAAGLLNMRPDDTLERQMEALKDMEKSILAYRVAIERVLGAPRDSITLFNLDLLREWVLTVDPPSASTIPSID